MKTSRFSILLGITVIFFILLDIYIAIIKEFFSHNASVYGVYHIGFIISAIILFAWYIYEIRLIIIERNKK